MNLPKDAAWTIASAVGGAVVQLLQVMVAARFLDPYSFGALAIVNVMSWIFLTFQDMGLSSYCVHLGDVDRRSHSTLFWVSSALGAATGLLMVGASGSIADFYRIPELRDLLLVLAVNFALIGLGSQYQANLIRTYRARRLAQIELVSRMAAFALVVWLLASRGWGVTAIVVGLLSFSTIKLILMVAIADRRWHPSFAFDRAMAPRALRYGVYQAGSQITTQLRTQLDQLVIGRVLTPELLGLYALAKDLVSYPLRVIQPLILRLTLPILASLQRDPGALRASFLGSLRRTAVAGGMIFAPVALFAPWVVGLLYGERFEAVSPLLSLMAVYGALRALGMNIGMLAEATGRTRISFVWSITSLIVTVTLLTIVASSVGTVSMFAVNLSVTQLLLVVAAYPLFLRPLEPVGLKAYLVAWAAPFIVTVAAVAVSRLVPLPAPRSLIQLIESLLSRS